MKKKKLYWFPQTRPKQRAMFFNIQNKIGNYESILLIPAAKIARILLICETFIAAHDYVEQIRATAKSLTDWQEQLFEGEGGRKGDPAPAAPVFQTVTLPNGAFLGLFDEFKELIDTIKHADNYTESIGADLMIVGEESADLVESELVAELKKIQPAAGYKIQLEGSLKSMRAMRVEYWAKGAAIPQVFVLTKLPATMPVYPKTPGEPESGHLRCYLLKDNEPVGQPSPDYPVTLSP